MHVLWVQRSKCFDVAIDILELVSKLLKRIFRQDFSFQRAGPSQRGFALHDYYDRKRKLEEEEVCARIFHFVTCRCYSINLLSYQCCAF